jgi:replicative DNA helicase
LSPRQTEIAVLGAILLNPEAIHRVIASLSDKMFQGKDHRTIYGEMVKLAAANKPVTKLTVAHAVGDTIAGMPTMAFLSAMEHAALSEEYLPLEDYADIIADKWIRAETKRIYEAAAAACADISKSVPTIADQCVGAVDSILGSGSEFEAVSIYDAAQRQVEKTAEAYKNQKRAGYDTGLEFINDLTGPWAPGQFIIIGAPTKVGKSALAMQCAAGLARYGPVLFFSFEMNAELIAAREIAKTSGVGTIRQRTGKIDSAEYSKMLDAAESLEAIKELRIVKDKMSATQIMEYARRFKRRHGLCAVFVDHMGIVKPEKGVRQAADWELGATAAPILKEMAEDLGIVAVGISQVLKESPSPMSRMKDKISACLRRPSYQDLKGASANDADHVLMPFRPAAMLAKIEPSETSADRAEWEAAMELNRYRAGIVLSLSRESQWPRVVSVNWDGEKTSFRAIEYDQPGFF